MHSSPVRSRLRRGRAVVRYPQGPGGHLRHRGAPEAPEVLQAAVDGVARGGVGLRLVSLVAVEPISGAAKTDAEVIERPANMPPVSSRRRKRCRPEDISVTGVVTSGRHTSRTPSTNSTGMTAILIVVGSSRLAQPRGIFLGSTAARCCAFCRYRWWVVPQGRRLTFRCHTFAAERHSNVFQRPR